LQPLLENWIILEYITGTAASSFVPDSAPWGGAKAPAAPSPLILIGDKPNRHYHIGKGLLLAYRTTGIS